MRRCLGNENVQRKEEDDDDAERNSFMLLTATATATATHYMGGHNLNMCHGVVVVDDCHCPAVESHYYVQKTPRTNAPIALCNAVTE